MCRIFTEFQLTKSLIGFKELAQLSTSGVFMAVPTIYFKLITHFESLAVEATRTLKRHENVSLLSHGFRMGAGPLQLSVMEK